MISHKLKCIFIPVRRAAGSSITNALQKYCMEELDEQIDRQGERNTYDMFNAGVLSTSPSIYVGASDWYRDIGNFNDYFIFTIVRNPWDRLISGYFYSNRGKRYLGKRCWTLEEFIENLPTKEMNYNWWFHITRTLKEMLIDRDGKYIADFTIRYENLESDFATVCDKLGIKGLKLPRLNKASRKHFTKYCFDAVCNNLRSKGLKLPHIFKTPDKHYTEFYNDKTQKMVAEIFAEDIEYFGYQFGSN